MDKIFKTLTVIHCFYNVVQKCATVKQVIILKIGYPDVLSSLDIPVFKALL